MGRSTASIQSEITLLEARLTASAANSVNSDGHSMSFDIDKLQKRLELLYLQLDRASGASPMFVRGRIKGLGHGRG